MLFEWSNDYEIGLAEIDAQHRGLVAMVNELYEAKKAGRGGDAVKSILERLLHYTQQHFEAEEWAMKRAGYPDLAKHQRAHVGLTRQVLEMLGDADALPTFELLNFLSEWLQHHIGNADRAFGQFMRNQRSAPLSPPPIR